MKPRLKEMRKRAGWKSAREFAEHVGMSLNTYQNYELGRRELSLERAWELADALDCTLDELAGRDFPAPEYADPRQRELNGHYSTLNEAGKSDIVGFVRSYASDPARRVKKDGAERVEHLGKVG